jgi:hypothetical protein
LQHGGKEEAEVHYSGVFLAISDPSVPPRFKVLSVGAVAVGTIIIVSMKVELLLSIP